MPRFGASRVLRFPALGGGAVVAPTYLPTLASSPTLAVGVKRMVSGYSGNLIQLRRSSDNATSNFAAVTGSDHLDYAAINTWGGASNLFVTTLYDQTGNGRNLTQGTNGNQPGFDTSQLLSGASPIQCTSSTQTLTITGQSIDRLNYSAFFAMQQGSVGRLAPVFELHDGTNVMDTYYMSGTGQGFVEAYSAAGGVKTNTSYTLTMRANPIVFGVTGAASARTLFIRETNGAFVAAPAGTATILRLNITSGLFSGQNKYWGVVLYPGLSTADGTLLQSTLAMMFAVPTTFDRRIVLIGDSIMAGSVSTLNRNMPYYLSPNLAGSPEIYNLGNPGSKMVDANTSSIGVGLYTAAYGAGKCLAVMQYGTNDLCLNSTSGSALYTILTSYKGKLVTAGFKMLGCTILPRTDAAWTGAMETERLAYNSSVLGNSIGMDATLDLALTSTTMGALAAPNNTGLYGDKLHPVSAGYSLLANGGGGQGTTCYKDAINALLP